MFEADNDSYDIYEFTNNAGTLSTTPTLFVAIYLIDLAFDNSGDLFLADFAYVASEFPNLGGNSLPIPASPIWISGPREQSGR